MGQERIGRSHPPPKKNGRPSEFMKWSTVVHKQGDRRHARQPAKTDFKLSYVCLPQRMKRSATGVSHTSHPFTEWGGVQGDAKTQPKRGNRLQGT